MEKEYTTEELARLSKQELKTLFLKVRSELFAVESQKRKMDLEIYYCYIAREIERRVN